MKTTRCIFEMRRCALIMRNKRKLMTNLITSVVQMIYGLYWMSQVIQLFGSSVARIVQLHCGIFDLCWNQKCRKANSKKKTKIAAIFYAMEFSNPISHIHLTQNMACGRNIDGAQYAWNQTGDSDRIIDLTFDNYFFK